MKADSERRDLQSGGLAKGMSSEFLKRQPTASVLASYSRTLPGQCENRKYAHWQSVQVSSFSDEETETQEDLGCPRLSELRLLD